MDSVQSTEAAAVWIESSGRRHAARRPVVDPEAAVGGVAAVGVVADRERDEVRRRRLAQLPRRGRAVVVRRELGERAVGDAGPRGGRVDGDVVERLVGRLVVDGVPRVGPVGLLHRPAPRRRR